MSVNKYKPHVVVLPEDRANLQIANGFLLNPDLNERLIQVLPHVRGWQTVLNKFVDERVPVMRQFPQQSIVLLIDFDQDENRLQFVKQKIPIDLQDRVFVIGVFSEPENLRSSLSKSFEEIGEALAEDCSKNTNDLWAHKLLQHNKDELNRMSASIKQFLFD